MTDYKKNKSTIVASEAAREALKQMAARCIEPTPDNYRIIYNQIVGIEDKDTLNEALDKAFKQLPSHTVEQRKWINRWKKTLKQEDWPELTALLAEGSIGVSVEPGELKEIVVILQEMLRQSFQHGLMPSLHDYPELKQVATQILLRADSANELSDWHLIAADFSVLLQDLHAVDINEEGLKQDLLSLLQLLLDNISELVMDDQWMRGQIAVVQKVIASPLERSMIQHAQNSLKDLIFKQGVLKNNLMEAKDSFKKMIATFVDRLAYMANSSISYQEKIETFSNHLANTDDVTQINSLLESLMKDTYLMQTDIMQSSGALLAQRSQFDATQERISKLQEELLQLSEKLSIDPLTGVLNRRGLTEAMSREIARAHKEGGQLCVALLDIDNFKTFNDKYGHHVGDGALLHLAKHIHATVRVTDTAARFGGEEFVILLPNTELDEAAKTILGLQRALTKRFFLGDNERLLITFSAGIALFKVNETQDAVLHRADQAMYLAKKSGKNQVKTEVDLLASTK